MRDNRRSRNELVYRGCTLLLPDFRISLDDPIAMYSLVLELRSRGEQIPLIDLEIEKRKALASRREGKRFHDNLASIVSAFESNPTDFEHYVASVFHAIGYQASVTPPTNDGGYDIFLVGRKGRKTAIVEVKCYAETTRVSRPLIQKLVGANAAMKADKAIFATTSRYTSSAVEYAKQAGVVLIDGAQLLSLIRRTNGIGASTNAKVTGARGETTERDCWLTEDDLLSPWWFRLDAPTSAALAASRGGKPSYRWNGERAKVLGNDNRFYVMPLL